MKVTALTCSSCGASLHPPQDKNTFVCSYCGSLLKIEGCSEIPNYLVKSDDEPAAREELPEVALADFASSPLRESPRGVVSLLFRALIHLPQNWDDAFSALQYVLAKPTLEEHETTRLCRQLTSSPHITLSYLGGTPESGYEVSPMLTPHFVESACTLTDDGKTKLYIQSSGRKYASKLLMKKNKAGHWKIFEWSDLGIGVTPAKNEEVDF